MESKPGRNEEHNFTTESGNHPDTQVNVLKKLPIPRAILALYRLRQLVDKIGLDGHDDVTPGCHHMTCSWGLCNDTREMWPDAQDHVFPYDFLNDGQIGRAHV